jgi:hypothetical protein
MHRFVQEFVYDPWVAGLLAFALILIGTLSWWILQQRWGERKYRKKVERRRSASRAKAQARK